MVFVVQLTGKHFAMIHSAAFSHVMILVVELWRLIWYL